MDSSDKAISEQEILLALAESVNDDTFDDSFALLVKTYKGMLMRKLLSMLYDPETANDALQEALFSASLSLKRFSPERIRELKLQAWLFTITINKAKKYLEDIIKRPPYLSMQSEVFEAEFLDKLEVEARYRPETALEALEINERVLEAIHALPKQYQKTAFLYFFGEHSLLEITAQLDLPLNTVKSNIHRSRKLLKVALKMLVDEEG